MSIVMISESLLQRATASDGRILRDRVLSGFGVRLPDRAKPRARVLQEVDLPAWREAVDKLGEKQRDFLYLALYTGLRRNECRELLRKQIDLAGGVLSIPETKNGRPHSLPITPLMWEILERRCSRLGPDDELFAGVSAEHLYNMAMRVGSPRFMLHDLRKLLATVGEKLGISSAVLRRILNHTAPKTDGLVKIQVEMQRRLGIPAKPPQRSLVEMGQAFA